MDANHTTFRARTMEVAPCDGLAALDAFAEPAIAYFEAPARNEAIAAYGACWQGVAESPEDALELLRAISRPGWVRVDDGPAPPGPFVGGMAFDLERATGEAWAAFPRARWTLPRLMLWHRDGRSFLTAFGTESEEVRALLNDAATAADRISKARVGPSWPSSDELSIDREDRPAWDGAMAQALAAIHADHVEKVVLARAIDVSLRAVPAMPTLLARLREDSPGALTFMLRPPSTALGVNGGGAAFVGATPETLCLVEGRMLATEALAGSAPDDDEALLRRDKESREHRAVLEAIRSALSSLCDWFEISGEGEVVSVPSLVHRRTPIEGTLRQGVSLAEVVAALHPTPAVGGAPKRPALALIREAEGLDRGWYAGLVGLAGPEGAELRVALRSALIQGTHARLFAGAGIVDGSTAEGEWVETAAKAKTMLRALGGLGRG